MSRRFHPILALMLPLLVQAETFGRSQLIAQFATVDERSADFVEQQHLSMFDIPLESSGRLIFRAPDYLEKRVDNDGGSFRVKGDRLTVEQGGEERRLALAAHPLLAAFVAAFRATLAGDIDTLERYYRIELEGTAQNWRLRLQPRGSDMAAVVREIRIDGSGGRVERIETVEQGGDRTVTQLREGG